MAYIATTTGTNSKNFLESAVGLVTKTMGMGTVGKAVVGHTASTVSVSEPELQSQSVGAWSKSYRSAGESAAAALKAVDESNLAKVAAIYLARTGLLMARGYMA